MKPGRYYIGDLSSIIPSSDTHLLAFDGTGNDWHWALLPSGNQIFVAYTASGNGIFLDNFDIEYLVTNYHIGVINIDDIPADNLKNVGNGQVVFFPDHFDIDFQDGTLIINDDIVIETETNNHEYLLAKLLYDCDFLHIQQDGQYHLVEIVDYDLDEEVIYGLDGDTHEDVELSFSSIDMENTLFFKLEQVW